LVDRLRYGPRELCYEHVLLLIDIYKSALAKDPFVSIKFVELAIGRLFAFLSKEDMLKLQRSHSFTVDEANLHFWKLPRFLILLSIQHMSTIYAYRVGLGHESMRILSIATLEPIFKWTLHQL
jgi:hypothetical protein